MKLLSVAFLIFLVEISVTRTSAQGPSLPNPFEQMGISANGTYTSGGFDNISMQSGNLTGRIPLFSIPQKGNLSLSFSLQFNDSGWKYFEDCSDGTECKEGVTRPNWPIGPVIVLDQAKQVTSVSAGMQLLNLSQNYYYYCPDDPETVCVDQASIFYDYKGDLVTTTGFTVEEPDGAEHTMYYDPNNLSQLRSVDGTGYLFIPSQPRAFDLYNYTQFGSAGGTLFDRNGIKYVFPTPVVNSVSDPLYTISDVNGNMIQAHPSGSFTDSNANQIPSPSQMTSSTTGCPEVPQSVLYQPTVGSSTWTVPGPNGNVTYLICYTNLFLNYDFHIESDQDPVILPINPITSEGAPAVDDSGALCANAASVCPIQSVVLPNGTYWMFSYAASDPNNSGSLADGDVTGIHMPSGATVQYSYYPPSAPVNDMNPAGVYRTVRTRAVVDPNGNTIMGPWTYTWDIQGILGDQIYTNSMVSPDQSTFTYNHVYAANCIPPNAQNPCNEIETKTTTGANGEQQIDTITRLRSGFSGPYEDVDLLNNATSYNGLGGYYDCSTVNVCFQWSGAITGDSPTNDVVYSETDQHRFSQNSSPVTTTTVYDQTVSGVLFGCNYGGTNPSGITGQYYELTRFCDSIGNTYSDQPNYVGPNEAKTIYNASIATLSLGMPVSHITTDYSGNIIENTATDYKALDSVAYLSANLLSLRSSVKRYDAGGTDVLAETDYSYDDPSASPGGTLGLLTETQQLVASGIWIKSQNFYNTDGTLSYSVDGAGNKTHVDSYDCGGTIPMSITAAWGSNTTIPQTTVTIHDCNTGKPTQVQEPNDVASGRAGTTYHYDSVGNVTQISYPDGGTTSANYNGYSIPLSVTTTTSAKPNPNVVATANYDWAGRVVTSKDGAGTTVTSQYDLSGRAWTTSNPYYSTSDSTYGLTQFTHDGLGRKALQVQPDSQKLQWCFNGIASNGQNNCSAAPPNSFSSFPWVDYSDESGRHWQQISDGLGRLVSVIEPNIAATGGTSLGAETDYQYDMLGNLTQVNQQGKTRHFYYDGLSRLISSFNPEAGAVVYSYVNVSGQPCAGDPSMPCSKTDARNLTTTYKYDALNRVTQKVTPLVVGSDGTTSGYMSTCYQYDGSTGLQASANMIGHLTAEWTQTGSQCAASYTPAVALTATLVSSYDAMGRPLQSQQCVKGMCTASLFTQNQTYDLAGHPISWQDGRGLMTFTQQFDSAGRPVSLTNNVFGNGLPPVVFSVQGYSPTGGLQEWNVGNFLNFNRTYDNRSRVTGETVTH